MSYTMRGSRGLIDQACATLGVYIYAVLLRVHIPFPFSSFCVFSFVT